MSIFNVHIRTLILWFMISLTVQISDRTVWERDEGRRLTLDLCDKFSDKLLDRYVKITNLLSMTPYIFSSHNILLGN